MDYVNKGKSNEWYTPEFVFKSIGIVFDLDPCCPNAVDIPALRYSKKRFSQNGLTEKWEGLVFVNPPWSGKVNAIEPWFEKFINHGSGIIIFPARTSCGWFHKYVPCMDAILFPKGKTKFIAGPGVKESNPMAGITIGAMGADCTNALNSSNLGIFLRIINSDQI